MVRLMYRKNSGFRIKSGAFVTAIIVSLILSSCIDDPPTHPAVNDYQSYVDLVWELYDQKYVAFDVKNVDWDAVHEEYSQLAESISSFSELWILVIEMVGRLEDHNAWLLNPSSFMSITPTYRPDIELNFNYSVLMEYFPGGNINWDASDTWGYSYLDSIPYFAIKNFDYYFTFWAFSYRLQTALDTPGIIIDIRMSKGVSLVPAIQIPALFGDQNRIAFFTQRRTGPAHSDLSALYKHTVYPRSWAFTKPVIILTGEQVTGAAEAFASAMEHMPHVTLIGDTSGGGGNIPGYFNQIYWPLWENTSMTCPFSRVITSDTVSIEGNGILPDIYVQTTPADFLAGHDPVLEYAIEWIAEETAP